MRLFIWASLASIPEGIEGLKCHTCHGGADTVCPLQECNDDGQEYACENEIRTHNGRYEVRKVRSYSGDSFHR